MAGPSTHPDLPYVLCSDASGDEKEDADFTKDLTNALSEHPAVKGTNTVSSYSWPLVHLDKEPLGFKYAILSVD